MKYLNNVYFGDILRKYRKAKDLTQIEVAAQVQSLGSTLTSDTYAKIEKGQRNIFFEDFVLLKMVLEFEYADFYRPYEDEVRKRNT